MSKVGDLNPKYGIANCLMSLSHLDVVCNLRYLLIQRQQCGITEEENMSAANAFVHRIFLGEGLIFLENLILVIVSQWWASTILKVIGCSIFFSSL
jgi:hypothetical protein